MQSDGLRDLSLLPVGRNKGRQPIVDRKEAAAGTISSKRSVTSDNDAQGAHQQLNTQRAVRHEML